MKYAVNIEGVAALKSLSIRLQESVGSISGAADVLEGALEANVHGLGPHRASIERLISETRQVHQDACTPVLELSESVLALADDYQDFIDDDRFSSGGKEYIAGGAALGAAVASAAGSKYTAQRNEQTIMQGGGFTQEPRSLSKTEQTWQVNDDGSYTYNTPHETGQSLDANQGKYKDFQGTCGLVSCVNVLRMSGVNITEEEMVEYASAADGGRPLCGTTGVPGEKGGTSFADRQAILKDFGVESTTEPQSVTGIAAAVSEGKGVIASVDAGVLWEDSRYLGGGHAITVTSVQMASDGKTIEGFHVCDSGSGNNDNSRFISATHMSDALFPGRKMNVTSQIIR